MQRFVPPPRRDLVTDFSDLPEGPLDLNPNGSGSKFQGEQREHPRSVVKELQGPLRDFCVAMPSLMSREVDLQILPDQVRVALGFLRSVCPQDIVRDEVIAHFPPLLPPQSVEHKGRRTLVLDLDETLVHCHPSLLPSSPPPDLQLRIEVTNPPLNAHVYVRPFAHIILALVAKVFEVVVFTASAAIYADQVLDFLDPEHKCVAYRLYRQHCTEIAGGHFKDMRRLGRRLEDVILVDNSPLAVGLCPDHGILVSSWFGDNFDDVELLDLMQVLEECSLQISVPAYLARRYGFNAFLQLQRHRQYGPAGPPGVTRPQGPRGWPGHGVMGMPTFAAFMPPVTGPVAQVTKA